jgi:hypothetical protein
VKRRNAEIGATLPESDQRSAVALDAFVKSEIKKWGEVVKAADASANPQSRPKVGAANRPPASAPIPQGEKSCFACDLDAKAR